MDLTVEMPWSYRADRLLWVVRREALAGRLFSQYGGWDGSTAPAAHELPPWRPEGRS